MQAVEVGRSENWIPMTAKIAATLVVRHDQDHIGGLCEGIHGRRAQQGQKQKRDVYSHLYLTCLTEG
jgi:hypothetical protein